MLRKFIAAGVVALASLLVACGGGGGSSPAPPVPTATATPSGVPRALSLRFAIIGKGESSTAAGTLSNLRRVLDTGSVVQEPVEIQAVPCSTTTFSCSSSVLNSNGGETAIVIPEVVDANGSPVPEPAPTIASANTAVATAALPSPSPSASPQVQVQAVASSAAQTALEVSYPNTSGSLPVNVYTGSALQCPTSDAYAATGYVYDASGNASPAASPAAADVFLTGVACPGAFQTTQTGGAVLNVPYGGMFITASTPIAAVLNGPTLFTSQFTSIPLSQVEASLATDAILLFKDALGAYHKERLLSMSVDACPGTTWSPSTCGTADLFTAEGLSSNSSGVFAY